MESDFPGGRGDAGGFEERPTAYFAPAMDAAQPIEWTLSGIVKLLRVSWVRILVAAAVGLLIGVVGLLAFRTIVPVSTTYRAGIALSFIGESENTDAAKPSQNAPNYPNGVPFSPADLLSSIVLDAVYDANGLEKSGIERSRFAELLSVESFSPVSGATIDRYRERLANRTLTFQERITIEEQFKQEIDKLANKSLMVSFAVPEDAGIPADLATKTVNDIPAKWSEIFINRFGVAKLPVPASGAALADETIIAGADYPVVLDFIEKATEVLQGRLDEIADLPGAQAFLIPGESRGLNDIQRDLDALREFKIDRVLSPIIEAGLAKDGAFATKSYETAIAKLKIEADSATESARSLESAIAIIDQAPGAASQGEIGGGGNAVAPQIDSSFIDRIIALSEKSANLRFREQLINQKIDAEKKAASANARAATLRNRLPAYVGAAPDSAAQYAGLFGTTAIECGKSLNALWAEANRLVSELGTSKLNYSKLLYRPADFGPDFRVTTAPIIDLYGWIVLSMGALAGVLVGFFAAVFSATRRRS